MISNNAHTSITRLIEITIFTESGKFANFTFCICLPVEVIKMSAAQSAGMMNVIIAVLCYELVTIQLLTLACYASTAA
jgi:hypothetical protein